jgi:hypothetical protein
MCCIVYVAVTGFAGDPAAPFGKCGFTTRPPGNPTCAALPSKAVCFEVTTGTCSCDFYAGNQKLSAFDIDRERRRFRRRGLSAEKAERRVEAMRLEHERNPPKLGRDRFGFVDTIESIARSGAQVTLLSHFFRESFVDPFEIAGTTEMPLAHFLETGGGFPEDRLVSLLV